MRFKKHNTNGLTITELLIASGIGMLLLGIVLSMWYFAYRNWAVERIRTKLRINLEVGIERVKKEIRLSSATYVTLYKPTGEARYKAVSFPAPTIDANGFFDLDTDGNIEWDKSIIYHVYNPGTGMELRRTEFTDNRTVLLNNTWRYDQLKSVVDNGSGASWVPKGTETSTTKTIFVNLVDLVIDPKSQEFDGYNSVTKRSDNVDFGSILLESGAHLLRFEVTDKNTSSSGYGIGIDTLSISPSGYHREAEFCTVSANEGGTLSIIYDSGFGWSGEKYLDYADPGDMDIGDYITFSLYYDLWRESNFDNAQLPNAVIAENAAQGPYAKLADLDEGSETTWQATNETGGDKTDYHGVTPTGLTNITVRNIASSGNIISEGDLVRVKFDAHSGNPLTITSAYIDERSGATQNCVYDSGDSATFATRSQLFFTDPSTGDITAGTTIDPNHSSQPRDFAYSNWTLYDIDPSKDYFVTFHITTTGSEAYVSYWPRDVSSPEVNSYLYGGNHASWPLWGAPTDKTGQNPPLELPGDDEHTSSRHTYATAQLEVWSKEGNIISGIYDTKVESPVYAQIAWTGSSVDFKARSSGEPNMEGASDWADITGSSTNPHSVSYVGTGRYIQFWTDLSTTPYWTCDDHSSVNVTDAQYDAGQKQCTEPTCTNYLEYAFDCPWVDEVIVDWPGESRMCDINGYFAQKPGYGIIKLLVDGEELIKGLEFKIAVYEDFQEETYEDSITTEIKPRNTDK